MQRDKNSGGRTRSPKRKALSNNGYGSSTSSSSTSSIPDNHPPDSSMMKAHLCQQLDEYLHINVLESDVRPYKEVPSKQIRSYRVKRVISPYEFYLELALDQCVKGYYTWYPNMQNHYNNKGTQEKWCLHDKESVVLGRCYAYKDPEDQLWHRVRVHGTNDESATAKIFYCDLGKRKQVKMSSLLELDPLYTTWSSQLFRAYLYDIVPTTNEYTWPPEAIEFFKETVTNKEFSGVIMVRSDNIVTLGLPDIIMNVGVVLFDNDLHPSNCRDVCTLNALMVDKKLAFSIGAFSSCNHQLMDEENEPYFDLDAFTSEYPLQCRKANPGTSQKGGVALTTPKLKELVMKLKPPVPTSKNLTDRDEFAMFATDFDMPLPEELTCRLGHVKLCCVLSPAHLVGHYYTRMTAMKDMQIALKVAVEKAEAIQNLDALPGKLIACEILDPIANENIWCRAVIKTRISEESVKVILADYGSELSVRLEYCRSLPNYFEKFPSFAVRMHLDIENVTPNGQSGWSNDASVSFRRYAFAWHEHSPSYFGFCNARSETISFNDYGQGVDFDAEKKKWIASPVRKIDSHQPINELKDHPMLQSLYRSIGVALFYEITLPGSCFWFVEPLYDHLVENGFAIGNVRTKSKHVIHDEIVRFCYLIQGDKRAERKHLPFSLDTYGRQKGNSKSPRVGIFKTKMFVLQDGKPEYLE